MKYYLVDYENVMAKTVFLELLKSAVNDDIIHVLYTKNSNNLTFENLRLIQESKSILRFEEVEDGKQALDMQLASLLGFLIKENSNKYRYYIVSADNDYDSIIKYWRDRDNTLKISAIKCSKEKNKTNNSSNNKVSRINHAELEQLLRPYVSDKNTLDCLLERINTKSKNTKRDLHNYITRLFPGDAEKVKEVYKAVKPYL